MASLQPSSVSNIMKELNELEEKIDSLNTRVADMKKNLNQKANSEIDKIIPREKWIEIPVENKCWAFFGYQGLLIFDLILLTLY